MDGLSPSSSSFSTSQSEERNDYRNGSLHHSSFIEPDSDHSSSTKSLRESIFEFIRENGRTYHSYQAGSYLLPNDNAENERLDLQYFVIKVLMQNKHFFAPLQNPSKILDIGTGTGRWVIDVANQYPYAEVTGTDLSPIQPDWVPPNVKFIIDDASEDDWMIEPNSYDFIHTRMLLGSFEDFRTVIRQSFRYLKPGGYMESCELYPTWYCDDGTMKEDWPVLQWTKLHDEAAMRLGRPVRVGNKLKRWYEQQGFVDVHEEVFKVPVNAWPKDPRWKMLGRFQQQALLDGLPALTLAFFHRGFGWTKSEIEVYLVTVRKAIQDKSVHAYQKVYCVWGRKPEPPTCSEDDNY